WGRRPVQSSASKEHLAQEIARIKVMKFSGLSQRGLVVLARLRGANIRGDENVPILIHRLKKQEGLFARLNRKRRSKLGSLISNMLGDEETGEEYKFLPPAAGAQHTPPPSSGRSATIKEEIEESGLFGGIAGRIKKSADNYVNVKLDEIEARIDRKLDEI